MKIRFIRPNFSDGRSRDAMQPLAFAYLAGATPPDIETELFDERIERLPEPGNADLVAISVETFTARRAYQIAKDYRDNDISVIMGGHHPTLIPDEAGMYCDSVVIGDGDAIWPEVIEDARKDSLKDVYRADELRPLTGRNVARDIFKRKGYVNLHSVQFGRGCRFECDFCSIDAFYGANIRTRPVDEIIAELESIDSRDILFVDDNLFYGPKILKDLTESIKPLKKRWSCQITLDIVKYPGLLASMRESGCVALIIGFESLDENSLERINKTPNLNIPDYGEAVRIIQGNGIMIYGTFVLGYDTDTAASFERNLEFALESNFLLANFIPLTPTPGTPVYRRLEEEGSLLFDKWWLAPDYRYGRAVFKPTLMSPDELEAGCIDCRRRFYSLSSIAKRTLGEMKSLTDLHRAYVFLAANYVSRREIKTKQGLALGDNAITAK